MKNVRTMTDVSVLLRLFEKRFSSYVKRTPILDHCSYLEDTLCISTMLTSATRTFMRRAAPAVIRPNLASFTTVSDAATASDALRFSGYSEIDFTIKEDAMVYDAVQKFAAYNIGCLVVTDVAGELCWIKSLA